MLFHGLAVSSGARRRWIREFVRTVVREVVVREVVVNGKCVEVGLAELGGAPPSNSHAHLTPVT